jgi:AcrR family transcriptional regulator
MALPAHSTAAERCRPSRGGRPSREAAQQLGEQIVDAATELLLEHGFAATSIEAVCARAGVSKRTFYHRYVDKAALVRAVIARLIDAARPPVPPAIAGDVAGALRALGAAVLDAALSPRIIALHRLIVAESHRFPELLDAVAVTGGRDRVVAQIVELLRHAWPQLDAADAAFAANQFLQLIVSLPQTRMLGLGQPLDGAQRAQWVARSVELFVGGLRALARAG